MNLWRLFVYGAGLLILATAAVAAHAQIEPSAVIAIAPASLELAPGQEGAVAIEARNVRDLSAVDDLKLTFDPTAIAVIDSDPARDGVQVEVGRFLSPDQVIVNWADNRAGTIRLMVTQLSPSPPKSGTGVLAIVRMQAQAAGASSALTIERAVLACADGSQHPVTLVHGWVVVIEEATPLPTFTPQPTQAAEPSPSATPSEEIAPTETPVPPTAPTATATATSEEPAPTPAAPSPEPPTPTPAVLATAAIPTEPPPPTDAPPAAPADVSAPPTDTPIPPTATTMAEAAPTAVAVARAAPEARPGAQPADAPAAARPASRRARLLLVAGGGLLGLAGILGGLALVVYLRSRR